MPKSSLSEWLNHIESRHPTEIELGLDRVGQVMDRLCLGKPACTVISVAGTNGKGSCVAAIESLAMASGLRVGTYTSPHLLRYNERICIQGQPVADEELCAAFGLIESALGDTSLTYFEFGTLAALQIMADRNLDLAVLEVGMGGRLDAVNIIDADVAIITSIALDHQSWLGMDRDAIGCEKAGIARPERPVIVGDPAPPPAMLDYLKKLGAIVYRCGREFDFTLDGDGYRVELNGDGNSHHANAFVGSSNSRRRGIRLHLPLPVLPPASVTCALQALELILEPPNHSVYNSAISALRLPGRCQSLKLQGVDVLLDVAHNPAAGEYLANHLMQNPKERNIALAAVMADKDHAGLFAPLVNVIQEWNLANLPANSRAADSRRLGAVLYSLGVTARTHNALKPAFSDIMTRAAPGERIVVFGSFHTVAAILETIVTQPL